jgi:hypothetical protein
MMRPSRTIESILLALGASAEYRDDLLGDLAEELDLRARRQGEASARRWYYRESMRAVPHLLHNWWKSLRTKDVVELAGVVVTAYVMLLMVAMFVAAMIRAILTAYGVVIAPPESLFEHPLFFALAAGFGAASSVFGGFVAASLHPRAPLIGALALGVAWSMVGVVALVVTGSGPLWYRIMAPVIVMVGTTAGGVLHARSTANQVQVA